MEIAKTRLFCERARIPSEAARVFGHLASENHLRGLDRLAFVKRAAYYLGEINALHSFREGNGRAQRELLREVSVEAGWPWEWSRLGVEHDEIGGLLFTGVYTQAMKQAQAVPVEQPFQVGPSPDVEPLLRGARVLAAERVKKILALGRAIRYEGRGEDKGRLFELAPDGRIFEIRESNGTIDRVKLIKA